MWPSKPAEMKRRSGLKALSRGSSWADTLLRNSALAYFGVVGSAIRESFDIPNRFTPAVMSTFVERDTCLGAVLLHPLLGQVDGRARLPVRVLRSYVGHDVRVLRSLELAHPTRYPPVRQPKIRTPRRQLPRTRTRRGSAQASARC